MGQYLQPTTYHLPVDRWVHPEEFTEHARTGEEIGIPHVEAGPLVRSSFHAGAQLRRALEAGVAGLTPPGALQMTVASRRASTGSIATAILGCSLSSARKSCREMARHRTSV